MLHFIVKLLRVTELACCTIGNRRPRHTWGYVIALSYICKECFAHRKCCTKPNSFSTIWDHVSVIFNFILRVIFIINSNRLAQNSVFGLYTIHVEVKCHVDCCSWLIIQIACAFVLIQVAGLN